MQLGGLEEGRRHAIAVGRGLPVTCSLQSHLSEQEAGSAACTSLPTAILTHVVARTGTHAERHTRVHAHAFAPCALPPASERLQQPSVCQGFWGAQAGVWVAGWGVGAAPILVWACVA